MVNGDGEQKNVKLSEVSGFGVWVGFYRRKQINVTVKNSFEGGSIKVNGVQKSAGSQELDWWYPQTFEAFDRQNIIDPNDGIYYIRKFQYWITPGGNSNDIYMVGGRNDVVQPIDTSFYYLYHFNGSQWNVIDSSYLTNTEYVWHFGVRLKAIGGDLYSASNKLFKKEGSGWKIINDDPLIFSLGGSSSDNIYGAGINGTVYHFNGSDWKKIIIREGFQEPIYDVWTDGTEAFMVATDGRVTYVIHGK